MTDCTRKTHSLLIGLIASSAWTTPLLAQSAADTPDTGLTDIVVTAQKRSESLQNVPIAVSAFTAQSLENRSIASVQAVGNLAPSVNLDAGSPFSGSNSVLSASIRGIGQDDFAFNVDSGVGIYVDGIYLARSIGANTDLLDVERIEILKGPQGTLFGRNTIGGAISVVTRDPGDTFRIAGRVTTGSYNRLDVQGAVDIPLAPSLNASLAFANKDRKGYQKRIPYPGSHVEDQPFLSTGYETHDRQDGENSQTLRGKLRYNDGGPIRLTLTGDYQHHDQPATANTVLAPVPSGPFFGLYNACINTPAAVLASIGLGPLCGPRAVVGTPLAGSNAGGPGAGPRLSYGTAVTDTGNIDTSHATGINFDKLASWGVAGTVEFDVAPSTTLKSITSYRHLKWRVGVDLDGSPIEFLTASFATRQHQISQELQLVGKGLDSRLNYAVGLYYFNEKGGDDGDVTYPGGLLQINGTNTLVTKSYAAFAHLNYAVTDELGITAGGRYTKERKSITDIQYDLNAFNYKISGCFPVSEACRMLLGFPNAGDPTNFFPAGTFRQNFNIFTPKLGIEYKFNRDVMIYGSYSKGYKSGGWTTRLTAPEQTAPSFDPEKATTFEAGLKSQLLDRRLRLNLAAYTTKYQGIQLNFLRGLSVVIQNAGTARIKGLEAEATALLFDGFTLNAAAAYTDAKYIAIDPGAVGITLNTKLPKNPKWKLSLSPEYRHKFDNGGAFRIGADITYTTAIYNDVTNATILRRASTTLLNASAGYVLPGNHIEISVGGTNITNERYLVTGADVSTGAGVYYGTYSRPSEWFASLKFNY